MHMMRVAAVIIVLLGAAVTASPARADDAIRCGRYQRAVETATDAARVRTLLANPLAAECADAAAAARRKAAAFAPPTAPTVTVAPPVVLAAPTTRPTPVRPTVDRDGDTFARARTCADYRAYVRDFRGGRFAAQANAVLTSSQCVAPPVSTPAVAAPTPRSQTGQTIKDCAECPEMIVLPSGSFVMGSPSGETGRSSNEGPQRTVSIRSFAASKTEITFAQWDACVAGSGCGGYRPADQGWGRGNQPAINVSWNDVQSYVTWINGKVGGQRYRLLTEAEWEYAARGRTNGSASETAYPWGATASHERANYGTDSCCAGLAAGSDRWVNTSPVGSFPANAFGLYDMHGNVWEWTEDCYAETYAGHLGTDGSANVNGSCSYRVDRGGSWGDDPQYLRSADRNRISPTDRNGDLGFRLARTVFTP